MNIFIRARMYVFPQVILQTPFNQFHDEKQEFSIIDFNYGKISIIHVKDIYDGKGAISVCDVSRN